MIIPYIDNNYFLLFPRIPDNCTKPPTIYSILESIVNYGKIDKSKIKDLAKEGRTKIFDFDYPLSQYITKEKFECMILNHYLMRRIGFDTVTAFKIQLDVKLNEIMPLYNKMFDSLENWNIFNDGEITEKTGTDNRTIDNTSETTNSIENTSHTETSDTSDRRYSKLPQNQLGLLRDGSYVTDYNYDQNSGESNDSSTSDGTSNSKNNTKDDNSYHEIVNRSPADKIAIYKEFQENLKNIYTMIFKDLDVLFYSII